MGLFSAQNGYQKEDFVVASDATLITLELWQHDLEDMYGFRGVVSVPSLEECLKKGAALFDEEPHYFSSPPGPFKRVAAFLVLSCLYPFIGFEPRFSAHRRLAMPKNNHDRRIWHVRFAVFMLPTLFYRLKVKIDEEWQRLQWPGFPSQHYQLEFMNMLKWLDGFDHLQHCISPHEEWDSFCKKRLARMVMATSLALEASYYANTNKEEAVLCGKINGCMSHLNEEQSEDLNWFKLPGN